MILLDTCAIIWDALEPSQLTPKASSAITSGFIKLLLQARKFHVQEITPEIAELSVGFGAEINNDPTDRLIAATSILCNAPIVSADKNFRKATVVETIW
jgi:PIN domain nuclease of toxin-antitoxin system